MTARMRATVLASQPIFWKISTSPNSMFGCLLISPGGSRYLLAKVKVHDNREVHIHGLSVLQSGLVMPLFHRLDGGLIESQLRARGLQHGDLTHRAVLVDHCLK